MITYLQLKIKQLFCKHNETYWKEASSLEKRYWLYGRTICKKCGKVISEVRLFEKKYDDRI